MDAWLPSCRRVSLSALALHGGDGSGQSSALADLSTRPRPDKVGREAPFQHWSNAHQFVFANNGHRLGRYRRSSSWSSRSISVASCGPKTQNARAQVASPCAPDNQARGAFVDPASKSIQIANKTPYRTPASPLPPKSGTSDTEQHPCLQTALRPPTVAARAASPPIPSTQQRQSAGNSQINKPINDVTRQDRKRLDGSESKRKRESQRERKQ
jgi:hypothetical protein